MDQITVNDWKDIFITAAGIIAENEQALCKFDSTVGDGDHGITVTRGFRVTKELLETESFDSSFDLITGASKVLGKQMGGAIGPIFSSIFVGAADPIKDSAEGQTTADLAAMFEAGLAKVMKIGGAKPGDRTLVDAVAPTAESFKASASNGTTLPDAVKAAADAAMAGAVSTKEMMAKKGRAKNLREKSIGYQDAGATSFALFMQAMASVCK